MKRRDGLKRLNDIKKVNTGGKKEGRLKKLQRRRKTKVDGDLII